MENTGALITNDLGLANNSSLVANLYAYAATDVPLGMLTDAIANDLGTSMLQGVSGSNCYGNNAQNTVSFGLVLGGYGFGLQLTYSYTTNGANQILLNYTLQLTFGITSQPVVSNTVVADGDATLINGTATEASAAASGYIVSSTVVYSDFSPVRNITTINIPAQTGYWDGVTYWVIAYWQPVTFVWYDGGGGGSSPWVIRPDNAQ
jgi:hypothetical protein